MKTFASSINETANFLAGASILPGASRPPSAVYLTIFNHYDNEWIETVQYYFNDFGVNFA
jgi:hypothetical protein